MVGEREARMALCALVPSGALAFARALLEFGPVALWEAFASQGEATSWGRRALRVDLPALQRATDACGARFIIPGDDEWPAPLAALDVVQVGQQAGQPVGLWVRGQPLRAEGQVAVVGARAASGYGEQVAVTLAADLAANGRGIVSGLAFGIDAAAHRGALGMRGLSTAVVASGVDEPYPAAHRHLADTLMGSGALVSEVPPGERPTRHAFLARNRIIAALSDAVVIVEAAARSGAKNTASWASALGRPLLAVPGPVTSSLTATPHRLIREGVAILCTGAADVDEVLGPPGAVPEPDGRGAPRPVDALADALLEVRDAVGAGEDVPVAALCLRTGQPMVEVLANVSELVERGWLEENPDDATVRLPRRRGR
ncbi:DNA protecting protein DprA [Tessaracoccus aquimaris]|uniref:DNA protecting protein DprA n=1 Tax=Tessaracoccus aquimaris TaxID=1332264 RepID=A0A1Q2CKF3_9ACTN|nr:DNA-processing protein DprA [Tessaracoccus aquimaris]AQP46609.1 DNA protecting protein DprA [Tessaracoccus aquimaris]